MSEPELRKITAYIPVSDELLAGTISAISLQDAVTEALTNPQPPKPPPPPPPVPAGHLALLDATDGALRAVVVHHAPVWASYWWECRGCDADGYEWEPPSWPCSTVELIAQQIGIDLGDDHG